MSINPGPGPSTLAMDLKANIQVRPPPLMGYRLLTRQMGSQGPQSGNTLGIPSKIVPERGRSHKEGPHRGRIITGTPLENAHKVWQEVQHEGPQWPMSACKMLQGMQHGGPQWPMSADKML